MLALWHLVTCSHSKTLAVVERLKRLSCVSEVCCPIRVSMMFNGGTRVLRDVPWLGSMVLARWDGEDAIAWYDVRRLDGVSGILGGWPPAFVPDDDVVRFLKRLEEMSVDGVLFVKPTCAVGDIVEFSFLSFYKVIGECVGRQAASALIKIKMLGREKEVTVPFEFITLVESLEDHYVATAQHLGVKKPSINRWEALHHPVKRALLLR